MVSGRVSVCVRMCVCQEQYLSSSRSDERMEWKRNFLLSEQTYNHFTGPLTRPRHTGTHASMGEKKIAYMVTHKIHLPSRLVDLS